MKLSKHILTLLGITILGLWTDCRDLGTQGPPEENRVTLTLIDVGVREAYLHVNVQRGATDERVVLLAMVPPPLPSLLLSMTPA